MKRRTENPVQNAGTLTRIQAILPELKGKLLEIAKFVLENDHVTEMTIVQFIRATQASFGTVDRFCKRLGYSGFQDLKINLAGDLAARRVREEEAEPGSLQALALAAQFDIQQTLEVVTEDLLIEAAKAIRGAGVIMIAGLSSSAGLAKSVEYRLTRYGYRAFSAIDNHMQLHHAATLGRGDVALLISFSGSTKEILSTAKVARKSGMTVISLTNYPDSPLTDLADIRLATIINNDPLGAEVASKVAVEFVIHALMLQLARLDRNSMANLRKTFAATADRQL